MALHTLASSNQKKKKSTVKLAWMGTATPSVSPQMETLKMLFTAKDVAVRTCVTGASASIICQEWGRIIPVFLYYFPIIKVGRKEYSSSDLVIKRGKCLPLGVDV